MNVADFSIVTMEFDCSSDQVIQEVPYLFLVKVCFEALSVGDFAGQNVRKLVECDL